MLKGLFKSDKLSRCSSLCREHILKGRSSFGVCVCFLVFEIWTLKQGMPGAWGPSSWETPQKKLVGLLQGVGGIRPLRWHCKVCGVCLCHVIQNRDLLHCHTMPKRKLYQSRMLDKMFFKKFIKSNFFVKLLNSTSLKKTVVVPLLMRTGSSLTGVETT